VIKNPVDASAGLTTSLESYFDSDFETPQNVFQTGDLIYFRLIVKDPLSTIDSITFNSIVVRNSELSNYDTLYHVLNPGDFSTTPTTTINTNAMVNVSEVRHPYPLLTPNSDGILTFQFQLLRSALNVVNTLAALPNEDAQELTVEAMVDIWYHGNGPASFPTITKRSDVSPSSYGSHFSVSHVQIAFQDAESDDLNNEEGEIVTLDNNAEVFSLFSSGAANNFCTVSYISVFVMTCVVFSVSTLVL